MKTKKLVKKLISLGYTISFAESCTGGLAVSSLIGINNSSKVIKESYVTYSEEAKMKLLGVKKDTLESHTVYSQEVAIEMAQGVANVAQSTLGVGITGIAGPLGGTKDNPVGTVYFTIYNVKENKIHNYKKVFKIKIRNHIRKAASNYIISKILEIL